MKSLLCRTTNDRHFRPPPNLTIKNVDTLNEPKALDNYSDSSNKSLKLNGSNAMPSPIKNLLCRKISATIPKSIQGKGSYHSFDPVQPQTMQHGASSFHYHQYHNCGAEPESEQDDYHDDANSTGESKRKG